MKIIYPTADGIAVIQPTGAHPVAEVARKDVPVGVPYLIVDESVIPTDKAFRDAWGADFSTPDGVGADYGVGTDWDVTAYDENGFATDAKHKITGETRKVNE